MKSTRRDFVRSFTLAGATGLLLRREIAAAEPSPETNRIRLPQTGAMCEAPQYVVGDLLRAEGFSAVEYVKVGPADPSRTAQLESLLASGAIDLGFNFAAPVIVQVASGAPIVLLAGVHPGCCEPFCSDRVPAVRGVTGKTVAVSVLGAAQQLYVASMVAYIGLDPRKDVSFVAASGPEGMRLFGEGKVDGYLGFPPDPRELR